MKYIFLLISLLFFTSCANKEILKKADYKFVKNDSFLIVNPFSDPINLIDVFAFELEKRKYKYTLTHPGTNKQKKLVKSSQGSGFFINENGLIVTNEHVINGFKFLYIKSNQNKNYVAEVLYSNKKSDIALLSPINSFKVPYWFDLDDNKPQIGEDVSVLGYPLSQVLGTDIRITRGIVSSKNGIKSDTKQFQISAAIQPGNSGGPILNNELEVLGIATSRLSDKYLFKYLDIIPQNINFGVKSLEVLSFFKSKNIKSSKNSTIKNIDNALEATVLINNTSSSQIIKYMNTKISSSYKIEYNYKYYWEFDSISYLSIKLFNNKGEELIQIIYSGDSISSPTTIARETFSLLFNSSLEF